MLDDLRAHFVYKADRRFGGWRLLANAPYAGDCEDFALTAAWIMAGRSRLRLIWWIITCRAVFWFVRAEGSGETHWTLWLRGHGWTCNIYPTWQPKTRHRRLFPALFVTTLFAALAPRNRPTPEGEP